MSVELPIKSAIMFLTIVVCAGCAEMQRYKSVQTGPSAQISFISPFLEARFLNVDRLELFVLEPDDHCTFTSKGSISRSGGTKKVVTNVPANRRIYLRVWQKNWEFLGASYERKTDVSFIPEDGVEYTVEHIDNPALLRAKYYRHEQDGKKVPIDVQSLQMCESTSDGAKPH